MSHHPRYPTHHHLPLLGSEKEECIFSVWFPLLWPVCPALALMSRHLFFSTPF